MSESQMVINMPFFQPVYDRLVDYKAHVAEGRKFIADGIDNACREAFTVALCRGLDRAIVDIAHELKECQGWYDDGGR